MILYWIYAVSLMVTSGNVDVFPVKKVIKNNLLMYVYKGELASVIAINVR